MGTLSDITAKANNAPIQTPEPKKFGKGRAEMPHFMSPTIASSNQAGRTQTDTDERVSTPFSITSSITSTRDKATSWMSSAKRVVGISHIGNGIPRSKKEGKSLQKVSHLTGLVSQKNHSICNFHSAVSSSLIYLQSVAQAQEVASKPHTPNLPSTKPSIPPDKPLPSPPIAQDVRSPIAPPRGLIDASDKPLRRSPPGDPQQQEDWPVLFPEKPTTPGTLNRMIQKNALVPSKQEYVGVSPAQISTHRPLHVVTSDQSIYRKPSHQNSKMNGSNLIPATSTNGKIGSATTDPGALKSKELSYIHPRPTRTSTLRAQKLENDSIARAGVSQQSKTTNFVDSHDKARDSSEVSRNDSQESAPLKLPRGRKVPVNTGSVGRRAGTLQSVSSQANLRAPRTSLTTPKTLEMKVQSSSASGLPPGGRRKSSVNAENGRHSTCEEPHKIPEARTINRSAELMMEKRLSMKSPDHGPTLKIYRSAENVIMGETLNAENSQKSKDTSSIDLRRIAATNELRKARATSDSTQLSSIRFTPVENEICGKDDAEVTKKDCVLPTNNYHHFNDEWDKTLNRSDPFKTREVDDPFLDPKVSMSESNFLSHSSETVHRTSSEVHSVSTLCSQSFNTTSQEPMDAPISEPRVSTPEPMDESLSSHAKNFPPRGSSRISRPDSTASQTKMERRFSDELLIRQNKLTISPIKAETRFSDEFTIRQNSLGKAHGLDTVEYAGDNQKRTSTGQLSHQSQVSATKGGVLSNFRGLFHNKRTLNNTAHGPLSKGKLKVKIANNESPFPPISEVHPCHRPTPTGSVSSRRHGTRGAPNFNMSEQMTTLRSPSNWSSKPFNITRAVEMAERMCELATTQPTLLMKERALAVSTLMVDAVTQAQYAQKAFEEARQASRQAEVASALCEKHVSDMMNSLHDWKATLDS